MLYVNDTYYDQSYFDGWFARLDRHPAFRQERGRRLAVCVSDQAFWIAVCLYAKENGLSVFPLPPDMPLIAARRRARRGGCQELLFGQSPAAALTDVLSLEAELPATAHPPALIQTSSGTTGQPKFIERSWQSIDHEITAYLEHFTGVAESTCLIACPVTHSYGLISGVLASIARGAQPVIVANMNPKYVLRKVSTLHAPLVYSSPALIRTISLLAPQDSLRLSFMTSGSMLQRTWFEEIKSKGLRLHQQYGCSEVGCITLGQDITLPSDLGSPLPHLEVHAGTEGARPEEIVARPRGHSSVATRDLGYFEGDHLHFVSRLDDMINVSGFNVYPVEVEDVVLEIPQIEDAVVFSGAREKGHDQVCLYFVASAPLSAAAIRSWCGERLAAYQVPMIIEQVKTIPRLPNGKVSRRALSASLRPGHCQATGGVLS